MSSLISVLVPAYNCASFLRRAVTSILNQTYKNLEVLIVDDGSEDGTFREALGLRETDSRVVVFPAIHGGAAAALNLALAASRGAFIARQDADDWSDVCRIERQLALLLKEDADVATCGMARVWVNSDGVETSRSCNSTGMVPGAYVRDRIPKGPVSASILCTRRVFDLVGPQDVQCKGAAVGSADSDWNFRALLHPFKWTHVPEDLYFYRQHERQCTKRDGGVGQRAHEENQRKYGPQILSRLGGAE